jgi:hypothetical protein
MNPTTPSLDSRSCPFCAESINPTARVCPRCRQWLTWRSFRHPKVAATLVAVAWTLYIGFLGVVILRVASRFFDSPPYYTDTPGALQVLEPRMNWVQTKEGLRIFVAGILTNTSPTHWTGVQLECRFFNAAGTMVDAANPLANLPVRSHDDTAFRVSIWPAASTNEYGSFQVRVSTARNTHNTF